MQVAQVRREDAAVLLKKERYAGAIYLAGYCVECLLKWAVTERAESLYLPAELEIHDLDRLLLAAGLAPALMKEGELRAVFWALAESWGPELRYFAKAPERNEAKSLYENILKVYSWIAEQTLLA
jgi:hypothetical protein